MNIKNIYNKWFDLNRQGILWMRRHLIEIVCALAFLTASVVVLWPLIYLKIPSGHLGVIYKPFFEGVDLDKTLSEGIHFIWPWDKVFTYSIQLQKSTFDLDILTSDLLKSKVTVAVEYSAESQTLPYLHKYVGLDYVEKLIVPQLTSVTRQLVGKLSSSNAFTESLESVNNDIAINADQVLIDGFMPAGLINFRLIRVSDVQITKVSFPEIYEKAVENKMVEKANAQAGLFRIEAARYEATRKSVEAEGIRKFQDTVAGGLTENYLRFVGITATEKLAESNNSKVVIFGNNPSGLPLILGGVEQSEKNKSTSKTQPAAVKDKTVKPEN